MTPKLSITGRLYLGFLALLLLALIVLGTLSMVWFQKQQSDNLDQFLETEAQSVSSRLEGLASDAKSVLDRNLQKLMDQRQNRAIPYKTTLLIVDENNHVLAQSNHALDLSGPFRTLSPTEPIIENVRSLQPYRVISSTFSFGPSRYGTFRLAVLLSSLDPPLFHYLTSLVLILIGSMLLLSVLSYGLLRRTLKPVKSMAEAAEKISEQNLGSRIPLPPGGDELSRLAKTFNRLLGRLETDYAFQERLVSELTHQLKTPLTVLRGRNELGLSIRKDREELQELVQDNISDIDSLVNLLNTLLELARFDSRIDRLKTVSLEFSHFVQQLAEEMEPLWLSKNLRFVAEGPPVFLEADPNALRQILLNLYDNARKYAPEGGLVRQRWSCDAASSTLRLELHNEGHPIPKDELELIFKRFFRSGFQNQHIHGSGLGLSIVRSLVRLHGGKVWAENPTGGGVSFVIELPLENSLAK